MTGPRRQRRLLCARAALAASPQPAAVATVQLLLHLATQRLHLTSDHRRRRQQAWHQQKEKDDQHQRQHRQHQRQHRQRQRQHVCRLLLMLVAECCCSYLQGLNVTAAARNFLLLLLMTVKSATLPALALLARHRADCAGICARICIATTRSRRGFCTPGTFSWRHLSVCRCIRQQ